MLSSILAYGWVLVLLEIPAYVCAYDPSSGSIASGDLSVAAPYGLPPSKFKSDTDKPDDAAAFNITGYDVSTDSTPQSVDGWKLEAAVKQAVSLSDATNSSVNKDQVFEATTLYIKAPDNMKMDDTWRMCAVVYPGLTNNVDNSTTLDGSCNNVLSTDCIQALSVAAGGATTNGMDTSGNCTSFVLPARCTDSFPSDSLRTTAIAINQTVLDDNRFYAFGSDPTDSGDATAAGEAARQNVWTVLTIFGHLSSSGTRSSTNVGVQCIRAINGTTDNVTSGAGRLRPDFLTWATNYKTSAIGTVLLAGWLINM
ncbi:hypothetical protein N8I77_005851 [Diaporthe amygdali]|uniref:Uncharacterized protein n=1 Tax=Phomopsis amygdali TaxID=1214568 RepID=A0AAD9W3T6_PHOAM|nr:hypothetical protein N8I77_005851 [Diaporthe amygdali]